MNFYCLLSFGCAVLTHLTLSRPEVGGGEQILPARTFDVYYFFNKQAKATKLGDFS